MKQADEHYYLPDGELTILVSDTIFKVHRHILSKDGSVFSDMFTSNISGADPQEGLSDENPIQLQGDEPHEFRALLWCLYALPQEIAHAMSPQADIAKMASVLRMAHKYTFTTTELWAIETILKYIEQASLLPLEILVKISESAVLCNHATLLGVVRQHWRRLIGEGRELGLVLTTVERLGMRDIQGLAYQTMLVKGRNFWEAEPLLSRDQKIRLLSGYHNITSFIDTVVDPPRFTHKEECLNLGNSENCDRHWEDVWIYLHDFARNVEHTLIRTDKLDLVKNSMKMISVLQATVDKPELFDQYVTEFMCAEPALEATVAYSQKLQAEMMDFFEDVV